jgi:CRISPR-associated endoribonuclease Cas6
VITFSKVQFEIELLDNNAPTGFWGTRLRGGYGDVLKNELCTFPDLRTCEECQRFAERDCDFPFLFKPHSRLFPDMPSGKPLGGKANLPVPFVISSPFEIDIPLKRGGRVLFDLAAIGPTRELILRVVDSFGKLGDQGLDVKLENGNLAKAEFRLIDVRDLLAGGRSIHALANLSQPLAVDSAVFSKVVAPANPPHELVIEFVTPVTLYADDCRELPGATSNSKGQVARGVGDFYQLTRMIVNRIGGLWQVYGDDWPGQAGFFRWENALLKASKGITINEIELRRKRIHRFSKKQDRPIIMDGFVGAIHAEGDFASLMEPLLLGELFHIGESTAYGFGQYKMVF